MAYLVAEVRPNSAEPIGRATNAIAKVARSGVAAVGRSREEDKGEHDHRSGGVNIEVEELNGADKRGNNDFITGEFTGTCSCSSSVVAVACIILFSYF